MQNLREMWATGASTFGCWLSVASSASAEACGHAGFDYVCVDNQHGAIDYQTSVAMIQGILVGGGLPIVRVPWNEPGIIGKMLDAGSQGVIVPMVNTRQAAEAVVSAVRYAPEGSRSYGPLMAAMRNSSYHPTANASIAAIPMIETVEALENLDDILSVPGVDAIYVGPADLSLSLGLAPKSNDGEPLFDEALAKIVAACRRHGVTPGMHSTGDLAARRLEQGFQMLTVAGDLLNMRAAVAAELAKARGAAAAPKSDAIY